jgi:hypothetical protein
MPVALLELRWEIIYVLVAHAVDMDVMLAAGEWAR